MRRSLRTTVHALAIGLFLALFDVFRFTATRFMDGNLVGFHEVAHRVLPTWLTIALASPWCAFMALRFPFRPGRTGRTVLAHLGGAAVFTALHLGLLITLHLARRGLGEFFGVPALVHTYLFYVAMEISVYAAIVLVLQLLEARREAAERELAAARLERDATAARLESLQSQIRPHFLFNTLNALAVLARRGDGAAVDRAIGDLGEMLRASFRSPGRLEIPLGEELDLLGHYLNLQRIRFPDRLDVAVDVPDALRAALVPALVVQPLVENAIEHGLASSRAGRIRVGARRDGDALAIEVSDDGPGFRGATAGAPGIGLANTRERLALLHGAAASLTCDDLPGGGARVRLRLPWRTEPAGGGAA